MSCADLVRSQPGVDAAEVQDTFSIISDRLEGKVWMGGLVMTDIYDNLLEVGHVCMLKL